MQRTVLSILLAAIVLLLLAAVLVALLPDEPAADGWRTVNGEAAELLDGTKGNGKDAGGRGSSTDNGGERAPGQTGDGNAEERDEDDGDREDDSPGIVNINRATAEELDTLPGIGPAKARAIIEYRETYGEFQTLEQLMEVKGIGQKTFERLKERIGL